MKTLLTLSIICFSIFAFAQKIIPNKSELCIELTKMRESDQLYRSKTPDDFNPDKGDYSKKEIDSLKLLQRKIDNYNTEQLIKLTKEYGWLSNERLDCKELDIWLIFRHSQHNYFNEISKLINKELKAKRLRAFEHQLIEDHINGRPRG